MGEIWLNMHENGKSGELGFQKLTPQVIKIKANVMVGRNLFSH